MDNCWLSCQVMAGMKKVNGVLIIINLYNGQKINVVYECPHIYGNALDPPLFPWKFLSAYYTCELGWHMWKSGREGQLYQKKLCPCA